MPVFEILVKMHVIILIIKTIQIYLLEEKGLT